MADDDAGGTAVAAAVAAAAAAAAAAASKADDDSGSPPEKKRARKDEAEEVAKKSFGVNNNNSPFGPKGGGKDNDQQPSSLSDELFGPSSSGGGGLNLFGMKDDDTSKNNAAEEEDVSKTANAKKGDDGSSSSDSAEGGGSGDSSSSDEVQYVETSPPRKPSPSSSSSSVARKPSPNSRKMSPQPSSKVKTRIFPTGGKTASPFDSKTSAHFAAQANQLRRRNLFASENTSAKEGAGDGYCGGFKRVYGPSPSKGGGGKQGEEIVDEYADDYDEEEDFYGIYDEEDDEEDYYNQELEEEGPDGLTATERMYIQREYEETNLSEREWMIRCRTRRRLNCDISASALGICSTVVGGTYLGDLPSVQFWKDSSPSALAATRARAAAASKKKSSATSTDPYDLLNSDNEPEEVTGELIRRREKAFDLCKTIVDNMGVLVIKNSRAFEGTGQGKVGGSSSAYSGIASANNNDSDVEILGSCLPHAAQSSEHIIPPDLMKELVEAARKIEREMCDRLDAKGEKWRAVEEAVGSSTAAQSLDCSGSDEKKDDSMMAVPEEEMKMPSRETVAKEEEEERKRKNSSTKNAGEMNFRYHEVASRCPGRIDSRYKMDCAPFNDPRVIANPVLLPIMKSMLGGEEGGAELVYAGLIYSFPNSSDQPWHMDGAALFPDEQWLDLPPYAFNVFIPLEDVTDELGPTEFLPASHKYEKAEAINEDLAEWAMIESRWMAAADQKASMRMVLGSEEDGWMSRNSVIAPLLKQGDALIYDYRVCHRGTKNLSSTKTRTMLYLMYARPWFNEHINFGTEKLFDENTDADNEASAAATKAGAQQSAAQDCIRKSLV